MSLLGATQNRETWNFTTELGTRFWGRDGEVRGSRHLSEQCGYHEGCGWLDGGMSTNITSPGWGRKKYLKPAWQKERLVITCDDVCCMRVMEPKNKSLLSLFFSVPFQSCRCFHRRTPWWCVPWHRKKWISQDGVNNEKRAWRILRLYNIEYIRIWHLTR